MSPWGDRLGLNGRPGFGRGMQQQAFPEDQVLTYKNFARGLDVSGSSFDENGIRMLLAQDVLVTPEGGIMPGIGWESDPTDTGAVLDDIFVHASLDGINELVGISGNGIAYSVAGVWTLFPALGISTTPGVRWAFLNHAGTLLFSNGVDGTYTREFGANTVTDVSGEIIAGTFANAFGRTFAGRYDEGGNIQALGVAWNASVSTPDDWTGEGSGRELLLSDQPYGADEIQTMVSLGFDLLVILCKNSIWLGRPTGNANRPADFRLQIEGIGCVNPSTVVVTPRGVIFQSQEGFVLFNGSSVQGITRPIARLPQTLTPYRAVYQASRQLYILYHPSEFGFIYQLPQQDRPGAWFQMCMTAEKLIAVMTTNPDATGVTRYDGNISLYPTAFGGPATGDVANYHLSPKIVLSHGSPLARSRPMTTVALEIEYAESGLGGSVVELYVVPPSQDIEAGPPVNPIEFATVYSDGRTLVSRKDHISTGHGSLLIVRWQSASAELRAIRQFVQDSGHELTAVQ